MLLGLHHITALAGDPQATLDYGALALKLRLQAERGRMGAGAIHHVAFRESIETRLHYDH